MYKGLIILANGFEDVEALGTIDILRRSGIQIDTYGLYDYEVLTQSGHTIKVENLLKDLKQEKRNTYDFLVIPGGKAVFNVLEKDKLVNNIIDYFYLEQKLICAICAAPMILANLGYFKDQTYTVFPNCIATKVPGKNTKRGVEVSSDETFITARSMYYTTDFALAIISTLQGAEQAKKVKHQIMGIY